MHACRAVPTGLNPATLIGEYVTIEPYTVLRACRVEPRVLIGARSVVCEGAIVESESILAPCSVVPPARRIPSGELWAGNPAKFVRKLTGQEVGVQTCSAVPGLAGVYNRCQCLLAMAASLASPASSEHALPLRLSCAAGTRDC